MKPYLNKKVLVLTLLILGGILFFSFLSVDQARAETKWRCTCHNGQGTDITDYAPYTSACQFCEYWCAAYQGVSSCSLYPQPTVCFYCCCNNGDFDSGDQLTDCSAYCASSGVKNSGSYDCANPSAVPACNVDACQQCKNPCYGTADEAACITNCENGPACGGGGGGPGPGPDQPGPDPGPLTRIGNVIMPNFIGYDSISALLGAIANFIINNIAIPFAVIMIIYSGFLFITAGGNEEKIRIARRNLGWTVLGVAIILASKVLIDYITELLGGPSAGVQSFLTRIKGTLNQLIVVLFALATVYFIWGIVQFLRATGSGNEEGIKTGKKHMIWGIVGMAIMGGALGIVSIIAAYVQ